MKQILFFTSFIALIVVLTQGCTQSNAGSSQVQVSQEPVVQSQTSSNNQETTDQSQTSSNNQETTDQSQTSSNNQEPTDQSQTSSNNQETVIQSQTSSNNQEPADQSQTSSNNQETVIQSQNNGDMNISRSRIKSSQHSSSSSGHTSQQLSSSSRYTTRQQSSSSSSSGYQSSTLSLNRTDLSEPHILSIKTSGKQITGKIIVNDKLVKQIRGNKVELDLSPYLSVGENVVEINARHTPMSSSVDVEMNGPQTSVSQQNSGNGVVNSNMKIVVR